MRGMSTTASLPRSELKITEAATILEAAGGGGAVDADGNVLVHLIRPCLGKGRGRHVYEADMLQRHAESGHFDDWPMFVDHESPQARRAAGGLPRSLRDIGGRVMETSWDESVPAGDGFGQGSVVAKVKPVPWVRDLIDHDPKLAQVSLNTYATGGRPTTAGGKPAMVIEGFDHQGSVDWVTRAGAGGKVVQVMESHYDDRLDDETLMSVMEAMPDDRLAAYLRDKRPAVAESLNDANGGEEDDVTDEQIQEAVLKALRSEAAQTIIQEAATSPEGIKESVQEALSEVLPGAIGAAAKVIEEQAVAGATKAVRMQDLRKVAEARVGAHKVGEGDKAPALPERLRRDVLDRIGTPNLDDKIEGEGDDAKVTESAEAQFEAVIEAELKRADELFESVRPEPVQEGRQRRQRPVRTAVTENNAGGEGTNKDGPDAIQETEEEEEPGEHRIQLQEAGVDIHEAYGVPRKDKDKDKGREPVTA